MAANKSKENSESKGVFFETKEIEIVDDVL